MIRALFEPAVAAAVGVALSAAGAQAAEIKVLSANGPRAILADLTPKLESATGNTLAITVIETGEIRDLILSGAIYDVIIDLRPDSPTFRRWLALELSADDRRMLFIPTGVAHGFQTLKDETEVFYQMSQFYAPQYARGVRWNDPAFEISWPDARRIISKRDQGFPDYLL